MAEAVIFDMDGLLINSEPLWNQALIELIKEYGDIDKYQDTGHKFLGMKQEEELQYLIDKEILSGDLEYLARRRMDLVIEIMDKDLKMMPGVLELLKDLNKQKYLIAMSSSSPRKVIEYVVKKLNLKKYFKVIVSADDVSRGKPDPEIYLLTAEKLKVKPENCIVLEDAPNGVEAANKAGMKTVGVINEFADKEALKGADIVISHMSEFNIDWL